MFSMGSALVIEFFSCSLHCLYMETVGCVEKWDGDAGTGDVGTRGLRDSGTWGRGDAGTRGRIFTICLTFRHISQNPGLLIVTALYPVLSSSFLQCEIKV